MNGRYLKILIEYDDKLFNNTKGFIIYDSSAVSYFIILIQIFEKDGRTI
jgi:hypothetical protein